MKSARASVIASSNEVDENSIKVRYIGSPHSGQIGISHPIGSSMSSSRPGTPLHLLSALAPVVQLDATLGAECLREFEICNLHVHHCQILENFNSEIESVH